MRSVLVGGADHLLALADVPGHQLFAQHVLARLQGIDGHRGVQVQRQGDDHRLDAPCPPGASCNRRTGGSWTASVAVDVPEALARARRVLAVEDALLVRRPNVGDSDEFQVIRIVLADQHAALVAAADQADLDRIALRFLVAEISGRGDRQHRSSGEHAFHEIPAVQGLGADDTLEVRFAGCFLLGS